MSTPLTTRAYSGEADLDAIVDLVNASDAADRLDTGTVVEQMRVEITAPECDPARDTRLWFGSDGRLVAFGRLYLQAAPAEDGHLRFHVHPTARGGDLEDGLIDWGIGVLRTLGRPELIAYTRDTVAARSALLERRGFAAVRTWHTLDRDLAEPIAAPVLPAGYLIRPVNAAAEAAAWCEMFNQAFIDHYNHHDVTVEQFRHWTSDPTYRPELNLVVAAPDGTLASFCSARASRNEILIGDVGTRRGYRRQGLARGVLLAGLAAGHAAGAATARLYVDSINPTGATDLYDSVGFYLVHRILTYLKRLDA